MKHKAIQQWVRIYCTSSTLGKTSQFPIYYFPNLANHPHYIVFQFNYNFLDIIKHDLTLRLYINFPVELVNKKQMMHLNNKQLKRLVVILNL